MNFLYLIKRSLKFFISKNKELKNWGGITYFIKGCFVLCRNIILRKRFKFDKWHIWPGEFMPYIKYIYTYINRTTQDGKIVEIGCGLGNILNHLYNKDIEGYDISKEVIDAATFINHSINYSVGSFNTPKNEDIEFLIAVNFIHCIPPTELKNYLDIISTKNNIKYIILDRIKNNPNYQYNHDINNIIPNKYSLLKESQEFNNGRIILIYKKKE